MTDVEAGRVYRGNLTRLIDKVQTDRGLDLGQYRQAYVERRVASRLRTLDLHSYRQYVDYLDAHPEEYSALLSILTINVTDFYRDSEVYDIFRRRIIPDLLDEKLRRRNRMIRAWSAGCATGEEPYSMTMSFVEAMGKQAESFLLNVTGTDIDEAALSAARTATYDVENLKRIPKAHQVKYIETDGEVFRIKPEVARHVRFKQMNLFEGHPVSVYDVIFCRNVFIYFTREQQERILEVFWSALSRGGYLVLGRSEKLSPAIAERLELIDGRERIYRKPLRP